MKHKKKIISVLVLFLPVAILACKWAKTPSKDNDTR